MAQPATSEWRAGSPFARSGLRQMPAAGSLGRLALHRWRPQAARWRRPCRRRAAVRAIWRRKFARCDRPVERRRSARRCGCQTSAEQRLAAGTASGRSGSADWYPEAALRRRRAQRSPRLGKQCSRQRVVASIMGGAHSAAPEALPPEGRLSSVMLPEGRHNDVVLGVGEEKGLGVVGYEAVGAGGEEAQALHGRAALTGGQESFGEAD